MLLVPKRPSKNHISSVQKPHKSILHHEICGFHKNGDEGYGSIIHQPMNIYLGIITTLLRRQSLVISLLVPH